MADDTNKVELDAGVTPKKRTNVQKEQESLIYVGPNLYTRGILTYQVYETIPQEAVDFGETLAHEITQLFVPISNFIQTKQELEEANSLLRVYYDVVSEAYMKEVQARNV